MSWSCFSTLRAAMVGGLAVGLLLAGESRHAMGQVITSTFDAGVQGWVGTGNGAGTIDHTPAGGNPGGAISATDIDDGFSYFVAPSAFLVSNLYGQTVSFDLKTTATGNNAIAFPVQLTLTGGGLTLIGGRTLPTDSFVNYSFSLTETDNWRLYPDRNNSYSPVGGVAPTLAQVQTVMNNLTGLLIGADYTSGTTATGTTEITTIDNVVLTIPEPASVCLAVVAVAGAWLLRRR